MTICHIPPRNKIFFYGRNFSFSWGAHLNFILFLLRVGGGGGMTGKCFRNVDAQSFMWMLFHSENFAFYPRFSYHPRCIYKVYLRIAMFSFCVKKNKNKTLQVNMHYIRLDLKVTHPSILIPTCIYLSLNTFGIFIYRMI